MSARNTQGAFSLTMSFFASGAGAWVLFTVPEAAILGGPVAILGYAISCVVPLLIFACVAPALRRRLPYGITFFEFVQARYGTVVNGYVTLISIFYMFLYLAAEFTSVGDCVALLSEPSDNSNVAPIIGVSLVTLLYTSVGGLPVSLITDRIQGAGVLIVTVLIVLAILGHLLFPAYDDLDAASTALKVAEQSANWKMVTSWGINDDPGNSFRMAIVLILAVTSANLMHGGFQQRIWAAEDNAAVKQGLWGAAIITIPFILIFGLFGMISFAHFGWALITPNYVAFLSAFYIFGLCPSGWQVLAIILAVMMVASSADTIQTGLAGLFSPVIDRVLKLTCGKEGAAGFFTSKWCPLLINLFCTVVINIIAIVLATQGLSVLSLFVLADLLCATCCVPVLMGLSDKIHPIGALSGCVSGFVTALLVYGVGIDSRGEPGGFSKLLAPGGLYSYTSFVAFLVTPVVSGIVTLLVALPFYVRGYRFAGYPPEDSTVAKPTTTKDVEIYTAP